MMIKFLFSHSKNIKTKLQSRVTLVISLQKIKNQDVNQLTQASIPTRSHLNQSIHVVERATDTTKALSQLLEPRDPNYRSKQVRRACNQRERRTEHQRTEKRQRSRKGTAPNQKQQNMINIRNIKRIMKANSKNSKPLNNQ